mgnify:CR=1 FL=1
MDREAKIPVFTAVGSEKIHGSNAAVCYSHKDGFWAQSRKNIITPEKDNAGCAFAAMEKADTWLELIIELAHEYNIDLNRNIISVYYEWSGGNIQKKSALTGKEKLAMIFRHFKCSPITPNLNDNGEEEDAYWLETSVVKLKETNTPYRTNISNHDADIYNIMDYQTA